MPQPGAGRVDRLFVPDHGGGPFFKANNNIQAPVLVDVRTEDAVRLFDGILNCVGAPARAIIAQPEITDGEIQIAVPIATGRASAIVAPSTQTEPMTDERSPARSAKREG